jgi:hypothetical protein
MASPKIEVFFVYDGTGAPLTGLTPTFEVYKDDLGANLTQPTITEIGGGAYKFTPVFPANRGIAYIVLTGGNPARIAKFIRPEDYNLDNADVPTSSRAASTLEGKVDELLQIGKGKWEIKTSGPDANRLIIYEADGTTVLRKFDLFDKDGLPTAINPFKRVPV